jgi:hypothetical protein
MGSKIENTCNNGLFKPCRYLHMYIQFRTLYNKIGLIWAAVLSGYIITLKNKQKLDVSSEGPSSRVRDCSLFIVQGETEEKLYSYNIFSLPPS